ncbi:MAG: hypothetical protein PHU21_09560 [Elusimicrobia bacterium]|nr:hypothetical protein [Elusimicrobiota bacterium]
MTAAVLGFLLFWAAPPASGQVAMLQVLPQSGPAIRIPQRQVLRLGRRIWYNECRGTYAGLTSWNRGEEFASLGIGHFIWYPENRSGPFQESFPMLLAYLESQGEVLPEWLKVSVGCPWPNREAFLADVNSERMRDLRRLLTWSMPLQARFIVDRLAAALPKMLRNLPRSERRRVRFQFYRMAGQAAGVYALVDYVNFKGEGLKGQERYNGQAWGLLQVLQGMTGKASGQAALDEFAASADRVLTRRVLNSPPERNEARWLPGWRQRLRTYRTPNTDS